jgi:acetoin utilization deacetylase AcuC-like enzyme
MDDPLAGMRLTAPYFGRLTAAIAASADECCGGRVVAVSEGGYDLKGLAESLRASLRALAGEWSASDMAAPQGSTPRGDATLEAVTPHLANFWQL